MIAHEGRQVRLGAEQPVEVALDQDVELAGVLAGADRRAQHAY